MPSSGSTGMKFVPVNTTQNLAAPIPIRVIPKKTLLQRVHDSVARLNPLAPSRPAMPTIPKPTTAPPKDSQGSSGIANLLPHKPRVSDFVTGTFK
jgi:hypothetical protein